MSQTNTPVHRARGGARRPLLIALGVLVAGVVILALALPAIAGAIGKGIIQSAASKSLEGDVALDSLDLSWGGPQRIGGLTLHDTAGAEVAVLNASANASLLALATGSRDLGEVTIDGHIRLQESPDGTWNVPAATPSSATPAPGTPPGASPTTPGGAAEPLALPKGLRFDVNVANLEITATTADGRTVGLKNVKAKGSFENGSPITLEITADSLKGKRALTLRLAADRVTTAEGVLALAGSGLRLELDAEVDAADAAALAGVAVHPSDAPWSLTGSLAERNGRLHLASPSSPIVLSGTAPHGVVTRATPDGTRVMVANSPAFAGRILALNVPLPDPANPGGGDWSTAVIGAELDIAEISGSVTPPNQDARPFKIDRFQSSLQTAKGFDLHFSGTTRIEYADTDAGDIDLQFSANGIVDADGALAVSKPGLLRGRIVAHTLPTPLLQPFADPHDLDLDELFGPLLRLDIRSGVMDPKRYKPVANSPDAADIPEGVPYLAATIESRETSIFADVYLDADRLRTRNKGIEIQTDAAGAMLRRIAPELGAQLDGAGSAVIEIVDVDAPSDWKKINPMQVSAKVRVAVGGLTTTPTDATPPLQLESVDVSVHLAPDTAPKWAIDARAAIRDERFAAVGNGTIDRFPNATLAELTGSASGTESASPWARVRPVGSLRLIDVPTSLASLASEDMGALLSDLLGETAAGVLVSKADGPDGRYALGVDLEAPRATLAGYGWLDDEKGLFLDDTGVTLSLTQPDAGLRALSDHGFIPEGVSLASTGSTTATLRKLTLDPAGGSLASAEADLDVTGLTATIERDGQTEHVRFDSIKANAAFTGDRSVSIKLDATGAAGDSPIVAKADLAAKRFGQDDASFAGDATITGVPTSLAALFDPLLPHAAVGAVGPTVDLRVQAEDRNTLVARATAEHAQFDTRVTVGDGTYEFSKTRANVLLTPEVVEWANQRFGLDWLPTLRDSTRFDAAADSLSFSPTGDLPLNARNVSLSAASPVVFSGGPGDARAAATAIEVRNLALEVATYSAEGLDASVRANLFDSNAADAPVGSLVGAFHRRGDAELTGELRLTDVDTAAIDRVLGQGGMLTELIGDSLNATATLSPDHLDTDVRTPLLTASTKLTRTAEGMSLDQPVVATWTVMPGAVARLTTPEGESLPITLAEPTQMRVRVSKFAIGPTATPLAPGRFELESSVEVDQLRVLLRDGEALDVPAVQGTLARGAAHDEIVFDLNRPDSDAASGVSGLRVTGSLRGVADAAGALTPDAVRLTADVSGDMPTPIIDTIGELDGLTTDVVGPILHVETIQIRDLSPRAAGGTLLAKGTAAYATTELSGEMVAPGALRLREESVVSIHRITPEASERLFGVLFPFLESFEKTEKDSPARFISGGLNLPVEGDVALLDGEATLELGSMQFKTRGFFSKILKASHNDSFGEVGKNIGTIHLHARKGVISYDEVGITANDFTLTTAGSIDLVNQTMDVYVFVPAYAVSGEMAKVVEGLPFFGGLTRDLTSIPFRFTGPLSKPKTEIGSQKLFERAGNNLGENIGGIIGNILGGSNGDKDGAEGEKKKSDPFQDIFGGGKKDKDKDK